jgi:hypothetical protein
MKGTGAVVNEDPASLLSAESPAMCP